MRQKSFFLKAFALTNFILLTGLFLAYRGGYLDVSSLFGKENILTSPNGGTAPQKQNDSALVKRDSSKHIRLSSSKSMVITDKTILNTEPAKVPKPEKNSNPNSTDSANVKISNEEKIRLSSSKSAIVFTPLELKKMEVQKAKLKKKQKQ